MSLKYILIIFAICLLSLSLGCTSKELNDDFKIQWVENLTGDFSFIKNWEYPEGVYKNKFGQLSCDGICPIEIDNMKGEGGRIIEDSLAAFYVLIDTTHLYSSLESETSSYEFWQSNIINIKKTKKGVLKLQSETNVSTHSSLNIEIQKDKFNSWIHFNSIRNLGIHDFRLKDGYLKIDETMWKAGIIKAEFDFVFQNTLDVKRVLFWKGKIYKKK